MWNILAVAATKNCKQRDNRIFKINNLFQNVKFTLSLLNPVSDDLGPYCRKSLLYHHKRLFFCSPVYSHQLRLWHSGDFYSFGAGQRQSFLVTLFKKVLFQTSIQPWCVSKRYSMYMFVSLFLKFWLIDVHFECF